MALNSNAELKSRRMLTHAQFVLSEIELYLNGSLHEHLLSQAQFKEAFGEVKMF